MKAIRLHRFGGAEALAIDEVNRPQPGNEQVLVKVYATTVNPLDMKIASGGMPQFPVNLPWIPGIDFAGVVEETGPGVTELKKGDKVFGAPDPAKGGSYAEYVVANQSMVARMPSSMLYIEAASVTTGAPTAWQALFIHGKLKEGQTVLIHGGSGNVGIFAVQLAHQAGAYVIATASGKNKEYVLSLGADRVIDYRSENFEEIVSNVDLVLDTVGGSVLQKSFGIVKKGGILVSIFEYVAQDKCNELEINGLFLPGHPNTEYYNEIARMIDEGKLVTDIAEIVPYERVAEGWRYMDDKNKEHGKVVVQFIGE